MAGRIFLFFSLFFLLNVVTASIPIVIGAFNMRIFGVSKLEDDMAMSVIVDIILRYDLAFLQEIRNADGTSVVELLNRVNLKSKRGEYKMVASPRLGRTSSTEQYAYFYLDSALAHMDSYVFNDVKDIFEREPYIARFSVKNIPSSMPKFDFACIGIHTKPADVVHEIGNLTMVYDNLVSKWNERDVIFLGDFNLDCSYVRKSDWATIPLYTDLAYTWLIKDDADTTTGATDCAYDRIVLTKGALVMTKVELTNIYLFDKANSLTEDQTFDVSDHYPVEMTLVVPTTKAELELRSINNAASTLKFNFGLFATIFAFSLLYFSF